MPHLQKAESAIASFGQGCEGEPLLQDKTLEAAIKLIRKQTDRGTINLNTNGYSPEKIKRLAGAGLNSVRISLNSSLKKSYDAYYRPVNYKYADVLKSIAVAKQNGLYVSINLLVFPGYTDREQGGGGAGETFPEAQGGHGADAKPFHRSLVVHPHRAPAQGEKHRDRKPAGIVQEGTAQNQDRLFQHPGALTISLHRNGEGCRKAGTGS